MSGLMLSSSRPTRPLLRWHGGKWRLAEWIISHFPPHRVYVEPFGGAASVLIQKSRSYAEIYNDLDDDVVNLFRVLRGARAQELISALQLTPFARSEFEEAYEVAEDSVERARRLVARSFMGFGSNSCAKTSRHTGFRANSNRSGSTPAHDWSRYPASLQSIIARLSMVVIENRPAIEVMAAHDGPDTLHYVDPPYLPETRTNPGRGYNHEMSLADHVELLSYLQGVSGTVVLSGYPSGLYDDALAGWRRIEREAFADGARQRTEVLWINRVPHADLFCGVQT